MPSDVHVGSRRCSVIMTPTRAILIALSWALGVAVIVLSMSGCINQLAEQDLTRIGQIHTDLTTAHDEQARWAWRFADNQTLEKHILEAKLAMASKASNGSIKLEDAYAFLDQAKKSQSDWGVKRENFRDKISFLTVQEEKAKAMLNVMWTYIASNKSILELLSDQIKADKGPTPATQPATTSQPAP
jgi:hypothetical protein